MADLIRFPELSEAIHREIMREHFAGRSLNDIGGMLSTMLSLAIAVDAGGVAPLRTSMCAAVAQHIRETSEDSEEIAADIRRRAHSSTPAAE